MLIGKHLSQRVTSLTAPQASATVTQGAPHLAVLFPTPHREGGDRAGEAHPTPPGAQVPMSPRLGGLPTSTSDVFPKGRPPGRQCVSTRNEAINSKTAQLGGTVSCTRPYTPLHASAHPCTRPCRPLQTPAHAPACTCMPLHTPTHIPAHPCTPLHTPRIPLHIPTHPCTHRCTHPCTHPCTTLHTPAQEPLSILRSLQLQGDGRPSRGLRAAEGFTGWGTRVLWVLATATDPG